MANLSDQRAELTEITEYPVISLQRLMCENKFYTEHLFPYCNIVNIAVYYIESLL